MIPEIWRELRTLAQLEEDEAEQWYELCRSCGRRVEERLRPDVDRDRARPLVCRAAAGLAFYEATMILAARGELGTFAAGDLKLSQELSSVQEAAAAVRDARLAEIVPYLRDDAFAFCEVGGHG